MHALVNLIFQVVAAVAAYWALKYIRLDKVIYKPDKLSMVNLKDLEDYDTLKSDRFISDIQK